MLRSLPKSNKHSWSSSPSLSVCVHRGEPCCGIFLFFPFLPQIPRVSIRGVLQWRPTLACPRPDDSCLLRLVWLASIVATGELPSLRDFFFQLNFSHIPLPFPAVSSPTSLSQSLVLCHSLSAFAFFCPCVRSPVVWFGSSFLSSPRAFSPIKGKKKIFFHSPSVLFAWLVSSFSSFIRLTLEVFSDALDVQLRRRVRDADPENLNAAVSRVLVLDEYDEADRRSGLSNSQAQRSTRHGTALPVHVTSPLTVDAAPPVVHSSPFSLSSPPPPPPSPPLTPVHPWSSTLLMKEESCAPSQLDASVPVIVHKLGLYVSGTLYTDCENQSAFFRMSCEIRVQASPLWKRRCCPG